MSKDIRILQEKSRTFCGAFKIPLDKLACEDLPDNPRQISEKNAVRLLNRFELHQCDRLEPRNYVSAFIPLDKVPSIPPAYKLYDEPQFLSPDCPLICVHGQHRLLAARLYLEASDRWWVANIYSNGSLLILCLRLLTRVRHFKRGCKGIARGNRRLNQLFGRGYLPPILACRQRPVPKKQTPFDGIGGEEAYITTHGKLKVDGSCQ